LPLLQRQLHVDWPPADLFGASSLALSAALDRVFFVGCHELPEIRVEPIAAGEVADRMLFSLEAERERLMACYRKFRFAFPGRTNALLEGCEAREREMLLRALGGMEAYEVLHPYPVSIPALYEAMKGHL
jgi:hypothetical protein